jgi:hypothetical protein
MCLWNRTQASWSWESTLVIALHLYVPWSAWVCYGSSSSIHSQYYRSRKLQGTSYNKPFSTFHGADSTLWRFSELELLRRCLGRKHLAPFRLNVLYNELNHHSLLIFGSMHLDIDLQNLNAISRLVADLAYVADEHESPLFHGLMLIINMCEKHKCI